MRLLLINYEFPPVGGGASTSSAALARELVQRGHAVEVLTARIAGQSALEEQDGLRIHRVTSWRQSIHECGLRGAASFTGFAVLRLRRLLQTSHYDLIHCYFGLPCGPLGLYGQRTSGVPYVVSLRGSDVPGYDPTNRSLAAMHRALAPLYRRVLSTAAAVVANSSSLRDLMTGFHPGIPYEVIPNAALGTPLAGRTARPTGEPVRLLCVSRLVPRKNVDVLLQAMAMLEDTPVVLDVVGTGQQAEQLRAMSSRLHLQSRVQFHGALQHEAVQKLCQAADLFVLPALSESCSMAIIEAMTAGLPIVTTRVGGNLDLVRDDVNGLLVTPDRASELAAALRRLVLDPARRLALGHASQARIREDFNPVEHALRYEAVYKRAAASARMQPAERPR